MPLPTRPFRRRLLPVLLLLLSALLLRTSRAAQNLVYADARTSFSPAFLSAACRRPVHAAWARCIEGGRRAPLQRRPGRALVLPPFPRFAVVNPMHALVDHVWAWVSMWGACVAEGEGQGEGEGKENGKENGKGKGKGTVVLMGVKRRQVEKWSVGRDITARLDLDLENLIPKKGAAELPDPMGGAPTWGQWVLELWARGVGMEVMYADDVEAGGGVCFEDGVLAVDADFFGTAFRAVRIDFWPPGEGVPTPWADWPERWKMKGVEGMRAALGRALGLEMGVRKRVDGGKEGVGKEEALRVLVTTRKADFRRRWRNADEAVAKLRESYGDRAEVKVVDKLEGMTLVDQARVYNWADVLVGIHGASMANAVFMRDGAAVVEVWRCCHDVIEDAVEKAVPRAWTGWLLQRSQLGLSYLGCTEVEPDGREAALSEEDANLSTSEVCNMPAHMNFKNVHVDAEAVVAAVRDAAAATAAKYQFVPVAPLEWIPRGAHGLRDGKGKKEMAKELPRVKAEDVTRWFAPVGPAWTVAAVYNERVGEQLKQFGAYMQYQSRVASAYWLENQRRHEAGLPPEPIDSMIVSQPAANHSIAWHVGVVPPESAQVAADAERRYKERPRRRGAYWLQPTTMMHQRIQMPQREEWLVFLLVACCVLALWSLTLVGSVRLCARKMAARAFGAPASRGRCGEGGGDVVHARRSWHGRKSESAV